ncbi:MAG TPA: ATP synthase F1 subunit delta [Acidimicrobiales bacterium]|nr:ATP synthase F1 subunit delta [Acidimicrobiales bacterium]
MADDRTLAYADALFNVARAEGTLRDVEEDLFRFSQTLQGSDELREALTDPAIPAARRQQIVEDLLGGRASSTTVALVSMVVGTGRARELPAIIHELVEMIAAEANKAVAEVRTAVALNQDQQDRLAKALGEATGRQVTLKVVIDPSVLGGVVAQVGDTVIDGSVRTKLERLRKAL